MKLSSAQSTKPFRLESPYDPAGDQGKVIDFISQGVKDKQREQTIQGVTGSGKTYMMAKIVEEIQKPTLVIAHNKTLAAQLAEEFKRFFPDNAVHYFVSYYDYYQPESYIPRSDTYIEKQTQINEEIERLRNATTQALLTRKDVLIVASVSCIYGIGDPEDFRALSVEFEVGQTYKLDRLARRLVDLQFNRTNLDLSRGMFRIRGDILEMVPSGEDIGYRFSFFGDELEMIESFDLVTNHSIEKMEKYSAYPAKQYVTTQEKINNAIENIEEDLVKQVESFEKQGLLLPADRIRQRTQNDIEMLQMLGYCSGIENYSIYFDNRKDGEAPSTLLDYFPADSLTFIDESHITLPQISAMYNGDRSRKNTLVQYGFRLPSALNNRPLKINEFYQKIDSAIYVSATPGDFELGVSKKIGKSKDAKELVHREHVDTVPTVEAVIRPTGLLDPEIVLKPVANQVDDVLEQVKQRVKNGQRVLITTLTKKFAEELDIYFKQINLKSAYIHSDVDTLDRLDILADLRRGKYDVLIGINLLREGLDLPEVSLVAIFDADKEGFLRSRTSLVQIIGRAARHTEGTVIMYADTVTRSMKLAMDETNRRRDMQVAYNNEHGIIPQNAKRELKSIVDDVREEVEKDENYGKRGARYTSDGWVEESLDAAMEIESRYSRKGKSGKSIHNQRTRQLQSQQGKQVYDQFDQQVQEIKDKIKQEKYSYSELKERLQIAVDAMNFEEASAISEILSQMAG
jgi:excinuclease ABC subunit B